MNTTTDRADMDGSAGSTSSTPPTGPTGSAASVAAHAAPKLGFGAELRDAVSLRTFTMVIGVLALQLAFILSYVGAFHAPTPHRMSLAVVAPAQVASPLVAKLNALPSSPISARVVTDAAAARTLVATDKTAAALIVDPTTKTDQLLVASGGGAALVTAVEAVTTKVEASQQRTATVTDVVPLQHGDARGLTGFYLVIGWLVGGYLVAALFGMAKGARPANTRRTVIRLLALVPYSIASGLFGALIVDQVLGALTGHFVALAALGTLLVFAAGAVTVALQVLFDVIGIALTVLLFVVLGNPSAGGAYQSALLPTFWRSISSKLPNGAGVDAVRRIVYFGSRDIGGHLLVIALYATVGTAGAVIASMLRGRQGHRNNQELATA